MKKGFTLLELIVVIVIIGVLATLGFTQYLNQVECARIVEAKVRIGVMRKLAYEYYYKNGTLTGITNKDVGVSDTSCHPDGFYWYNVEGSVGCGGECFDTRAYRCTSGGKLPNAGTEYSVWVTVYPTGNEGTWRCQWTPYTGTACFGMGA